MQLTRLDFFAFLCSNYTAGHSAVMAEAVCPSTPGPLHSLRSRVRGVNVSPLASAL